MIEHFHFTQPFWLLALLPLALFLWWLARGARTGSPWRRLVDPQLLPLMLDDQKKHRPRIPLWLLSIGWFLAVLALANPAWEKQPQPLRQTNTSRVIVLDLSRSMLATDLKPSRLVRARFKVEDILAHDAEGQTGLVVFAGDAFTVSPLTRDVDTIRAQLRALQPSIMPVQGSRADLGLHKAQELLQQAQAESGQVILIADGVEDDRAVNAARRLHTAGYQVSVLGTATPAGAPIPDGRGGSLRDGSGKPVLARLDEDMLASIAAAGNGRYSGLHGDHSDLAHLLQTAGDDSSEIESDEMQAQKWKGQGPLLAVLILPIAALAFRRGWVLGILVCTAGTLVPPQPAMALDWDSLWQRRDQQAAEALQEGRYERATGLAEDPARRGSALYRQGDYARAAQDFGRAADADGNYNRGNALARLGRYKEAIGAYEQALKLQPDMQDALANKAAVEALLERHNQDSQQSPEQQDNRETSDQEEDQDTTSQQEQQASDRQDRQQGQDSAEQDGESQENERQSTESAGRQAQQDKDQSGQESQADSSTAGNQEQPAESEDNRTEMAQADGHEQPGAEREEAENQFAEANRRLDQEREHAESESSQGRREEETAAKQSDGARDTVTRQPQNDRPPRPQRPETQAQALNSEEQMAAQQWLRRIPDDPGGLLRRKFLYQYRQRAGRTDSGSQQNW